MKTLRTVGAVDERRVFSVPGLGRFGWKPTILAASILSIRDSFERKDAVTEKPTDLAILRAGNRRTRRREVPQLLMRGGLDAVGRLSRLREDRTQPTGRRKQQC